MARVEAILARCDNRAWTIERRARTRQLIELGLVQKASLVDLTEDDRPALFGGFLGLADMLKNAGGAIAEIQGRRGASPQEFGDPHGDFVSDASQYTDRPYRGNGRQDPAEEEWTLSAAGLLFWLMWLGLRRRSVHQGLTLQVYVALAPPTQVAPLALSRTTVTTKINTTNTANATAITTFRAARARASVFVSDLGSLIRHTPPSATSRAPLIRSNLAADHAVA
jgi:hypothetical protein